MKRTLLAPSLPHLAAAQDIAGFNIGILGGENAQERMTNSECLRIAAEEMLGVPVKLFTPADYDGMIQGLLGRSLDAEILGASGYAKTYLTDPEPDRFTDGPSRTSPRCASCGRPAAGASISCAGSMR